MADGARPRPRLWKLAATPRATPRGWRGAPHSLPRRPRPAAGARRGRRVAGRGGGAVGGLAPLCGGALRSGAGGSAGYSGVPVDWCPRAAAATASAESDLHRFAPLSPSHPRRPPSNVPRKSFARACLFEMLRGVRLLPVRGGMASARRPWLGRPKRILPHQAAAPAQPYFTVMWILPCFTSRSSATTGISAPPVEHLPTQRAISPLPLDARVERVARGRRSAHSWLMGSEIQTPIASSSKPRSCGQTVRSQLSC